MHPFLPTALWLICLDGRQKHKLIICLVSVSKASMLMYCQYWPQLVLHAILPSLHFH